MRRHKRWKARPDGWHPPENPYTYNEKGEVILKMGNLQQVHQQFGELVNDTPITQTIQTDTTNVVPCNWCGGIGTHYGWCDWEQLKALHEKIDSLTYEIAGCRRDIILLTQLMRK